MSHRLYLNALIISYALFPPRPENLSYNRNVAIESSSAQIALSCDNVRFYLADLNRAINRQGELRMLVPGCFAMAAPLLLFRLKRNGFSNCTALLTSEGVFLSASR
ncbi:MAG TPA: hypothetical protein VHN12_08515 [Geobacteraceae bacterium]|nr:hypothetical protein [Geobacteraceae bacterium]